MISQSSTLIIIPTYNEAENISILLKSIEDLDGTFEVLVVDDNSQDGTIETVKKTNHQYVHTLNRSSKKGLGSAYIDGFQWALKKNYKIIIQMDADLSHQPQYLQPMIEQLAEYDFIVGSRYVKGGGSDNWSFFRKVLSKLGALYVRAILNSPIKDLTGGFNVWKREVIDYICQQQIISSGYFIQIEIKNIADKKGFKHCEYPIVFQERHKGKSKINFAVIIEALWKVWKIME